MRVMRKSICGRSAMSAVEMVMMLYPARGLRVDAENRRRNGDPASATIQRRQATRADRGPTKSTSPRSSGRVSMRRADRPIDGDVRERVLGAAHPLGRPDPP